MDSRAFSSRLRHCHRIIYIGPETIRHSAALTQPRGSVTQISTQLVIYCLALLFSQCICTFRVSALLSRETHKYFARPFYYTPVVGKGLTALVCPSSLASFPQGESARLRKSRARLFIISPNASRKLN